ncbi:MAG: leucine-rich repeat domain-containing protein, partial [Candidatus Methanomethylophilus sp.]|nr:leucine-rich repeat domain-containing protein [Methanomethylophilus sp.]
YVEMPSSLNNIGAYAFQSCYNLTSLDLSGTAVTSIGDCAFQNSAIQYVEMPSSLNNIGAYAFQSCYNLTSLDLSGTAVTSIGDCAFQNCTALTAVSVFNSLSIGSDVFCGCGNLSEVFVTDATSTDAKTVLKTYFSNNVWSFGGTSTVTMLIVDSISCKDQIGICMDYPKYKLVYYDVNNEKCALYEYTLIYGDNGTRSTTGWEISNNKVVVFDPQTTSASVSVTVLDNSGTVTFPTVYHKGEGPIGWYSKPSGGTEYYASTEFKTSTVVYAHWPEDPEFEFCRVLYLGTVCVDCSNSTTVSYDAGSTYNGYNIYGVVNPVDVTVSLNENTTIDLRIDPNGISGSFFLIIELYDQNGNTCYCYLNVTILSGAYFVVP